MLREMSGCAPRGPSLMNRFLQILLCMEIFLAGAQSAESSRPSDNPIQVLSVPTPAEFFAVLDKIGKPDWAAFYRDPIPTTYQVRALAAVNLGTLVTDGYVAVEAQDGQQVRNMGKDIITLARALGVGEYVLARGKSISDFADMNDWSALKEELDATTNEVRMAMAAQRDEGLASLITAGAWLRALQVGSRAAEMSGETQADEVLSQQVLVASLRQDLDTLPETARNAPAVESVRKTLASIEEQMKSGAAKDGETPRAVRVGKIAADFVAAAAAQK